MGYHSDIFLPMYTVTPFFFLFIHSAHSPLSLILHFYGRTTGLWNYRHFSRSVDNVQYHGCVQLAGRRRYHIDTLAIIALFRVPVFAVQVPLKKYLNIGVRI